MPSAVRRPRYRRRNMIERLFGWLQEEGQLCTRFGKLAKNLPRHGHAGLHRTLSQDIFSDKRRGKWKPTTHGLG